MKKLDSRDVREALGNMRRKLSGNPTLMAHGHARLYYFHDVRNWLTVEEYNWYEEMVDKYGGEYDCG